MRELTKWDEAHMDTALRYAQLSTAKRAQVGAVIVKDGRILSIGYNGMPSGWDNCCEKEIPESVDAESRTITPAQLVTKPEVIHAESNAITKVARSSESTEGSTLYTTMLPCLDCAKLIYQSGIREVYYKDVYPKGTAGLDFLNKCKIPVSKI